VFDFSIFSIPIAIGIFVLIFAKGIHNAKQRFKKTPTTDQYVQSIKSENKSEKESKIPKIYRKKIRENVISNIFFDAFFGASIAWFVSQMGFLWMRETGLEVYVSDTWYGDTSMLLLIIGILGFQVYRYIHKYF